MKLTIISIVSLLLVTVNSRAQGTINFANTPGTAVTNSLTGANVVMGTTFMAALYAAPDGTADESQFVPIGDPVGFFLPGVFKGGARAVPMIPPGAFGMFQVRVWETAYGNSYEAAAAAPPSNGRTALVGKSNLVRALTGDPNSIPPTPPGMLVSSGLEAFGVLSRAVPSLSVNDIVVAEGTNGTRNAVFTITVEPPSQEVVSVDYATEDGSALAGSDYVATNGTLLFEPGQTSKIVAVVVTADLPPELDEDFFIRLSNATNAPISKGQGTCTVTEVRITGISIDVAVSFNTLANHRYVVEKSDDMTTWSSVEGAEDVPGTGAIVTVYDRNAGCQGHRIYRGRLLE